MPPSELPPAQGRPLFLRPYRWVAFALILIAIPVVGFLVKSSMKWEEIHPAINAMLNTASAVFLIVGWRAIKLGHVEFHRKCMLSAFAASTLFLISYVIRYYLSGSHRYPGEGWDRTLYLGILISHMLLALAVLPFVLRALYLGLKGQRAKHRKVARIAWPIWVYVSVTGLIVYLMLYPIAERLHP